MKKLNVWFDGRIVGLLAQTEFGNLEFTYDTEWLAGSANPPISMSLPLRGEPFTQKECLPFFDGLLPEGDSRDLIARIYHVSKNNAYSLLEAIGGEVAGALTFLPPEEVPETAAAQRDLTGNALSPEALYEILEKLPMRPLLAGEGRLRLSLAGAQSKVPICVVDGREHEPGVGQLTTHILKPSIPRLPASTENETFIMRLAAEIGLSVPGVEPRVALHGGKEPKPYLLVARYDRLPTGDGRIVRLHQEDFCQALGVPTLRKYQREGGPNLRQCFALVREFSVQPGIDLTRLHDVVIFNVMVGNADAHGKNFSILYTPDGPRLAPFYDLMSTTFYPDLDDSFAMKIGDQGTFEHLRHRAWKAFAEEAELSDVFVRRRIAIMTMKIHDAIPRTLAGLDSPLLDQVSLQALATLVGERAQKTADQVKDSSTA